MLVDLILAFLNLLLPLILLLLGYFVGRLAEARHYERIRIAEADLANVLHFSERNPPAGSTHGALVSGAVVIGQDYFKSLLASLRGIFGGSIGAYETLLDRGRREAIIRMKSAARDRGANMVTNVKFSTTRIGLAIEVVAYGTCVRLPDARPA